MAGNLRGFVEGQLARIGEEIRVERAQGGEDGAKLASLRHYLSMLKREALLQPREPQEPAE